MNKNFLLNFVFVVILAINLTSCKPEANTETQADGQGFTGHSEPKDNGPQTTPAPKAKGQFASLRLRNFLFNSLTNETAISTSTVSDPIENLSDSSQNQSTIAKSTPAIAGVTFVSSAVQPSTGKVFAFGYTNYPSGGNSLTIACFLNDGTMCPSFGDSGNGLISFNPYGTSTGDYGIAGIKVIDSSGVILIAGIYGTSSATGNTSNIFISKFTAAGILDMSFAGGDGLVTSSDLGFDSTIYGIDLTTDNKILVTGRHYLNVNTFETAPAYVARFSINGLLDQTFGNSGIAYPNTAMTDANQITQIDNGILICGTTSGNSRRMVMAKLDLEGQPIVSFGSNGLVTFSNSLTPMWQWRKVMPLSNGNILALGVGIFATGGTALYQLNSNGQFVSTFGTNGLVEFKKRAVPTGSLFLGVVETLDHHIVFGGSAFQAGKNIGGYFGMLDLDGKVVSSFGENGFLMLKNSPIQVVYSMQALPDGSVIAVGKSF